MDRVTLLVLSTLVLACLIHSSESDETLLSSVLIPAAKKDESQVKPLSRQGRSYYDPRYGGRPERQEYERPSRCGRCQDDDRDDDRGRDRDRYSDRGSNRPTYGSKFDRNDDDNDRRGSSNKNGTEEDGGDPDKKRPNDDKDSPSGGRGRDRHRNRNDDRDRDRDRDRYDDRDRYRPDYYDRFLRDPYRERNYDRPYEDPYRERRPLYDRYPERYDEGYGGRHDGFGYPGYRRPAAYDDRYDRGFDDGYGGYGPSAGRGQHDSFRPWDETYRGQAGWDDGGRGYYFASGRPEAAPAAGLARPQYGRPEASGGWQNAGYASGYGGGGYSGGSGNGYSSGYAGGGGVAGSLYGSGGTGANAYGAGGGSRGYSAYGGGYADPVDYRGSFGAQDYGYRQDPSASYGRPSGWHSVGERRPYRDQSGVNMLDSQGNRIQPSRTGQTYGQSDRQPSLYGQSDRQPSSYGQANRQSSSYGQSNTYQSPNAVGTNAYSSSSTTPGTSYLYQRDDEQVTTKTADQTTKTPS